MELNKSLKYRPEIDGLRTIAVLSVIIYHADLFWGDGHILKGGFFGVDIFFVISGFLITSLITKELQLTGRFSFSNFYERRARRLLPVLVFVFIISFPFAWLLLLPSSFVDFSKSIIASSIFLSNIYWYESLQVYGTEAANLKPFLHTWSLAVEEQYYIFFPILLIITFRFFKVHVLSILTIVTLISLQFSEFMSGVDPSHSFYLIFSRFWELLIGSLLAYTLQIHPARKNDTLLIKTMPSIGICMIVYAIVFIDYSSNNHPGYTTLSPIVGTVLIIWFSNKDEFVTKILSSKLFVSIGLISYSLYLWHFPVFSFLRIEGLFNSIELKSLAILGVFLLSMTSYKLIEQPFRSKTKISSKFFYMFITLISLIVLIMSYFVIKLDGYPNRFKGSIATSVEEMTVYRNKYWGKQTAYTNIKDFTENHLSVEVIGNSWAIDIANSLIENSNYEVGFRGSTGHRCKAITLSNVPPEDKEFDKWQKICTKNNVKRFNTKLHNTNLVIIADNKWMSMVTQESISKEVLKNIKSLRYHGYQGPIMVISNRPIYKKLVFNIIKEYGASGEGVNDYAKRYLAGTPEELLKQDAIAYKFYKQNNIHYYSLVETFCPETKCKIIHNDMPLYHDTAHITLSGAKYIGMDLVKYIEEKINKLH